MGQEQAWPAVYAGTIGQSVWRSQDGGETWQRASRGMFSESDIRAVAVDPRDANTVYAGAETGLYRSRDGGDNWERVESPMNQMQIWSLAISPRNPDTIFAGTCPANVFRTRDGGRTWQQLAADMPATCDAPLTPRVTVVRLDPAGSDTVWAGVEIAGVRRSRDGGDTWETFTAGLSSQDIHGLIAFPDNPAEMLATTNNDLCRSQDGGATWQPLGVKSLFPWGYSRALALAPGSSDVVYAGIGNGPPGNVGALYRSPDRGHTWEAVDLGATPNSTVWNLAFHPAAPQLGFATAVSGHLYRTTDGGRTWRKLPHEFGETRGLAIGLAG
jgi:photosystem II stability/assembly factor-like uncharacterized protein